MKSLTYGQKLLNVKFNPAELESVSICKKNIAIVIDQLNDLRKKQNRLRQSGYALLLLQNCKALRCVSKSAYLVRYQFIDRY